MYPLLLVGRGVAVVHQREVGAHPVAEPQQLKIPVVPPARVLLAEEDHQQWGDEQQPGAADGDRGARTIGPLTRVAADRAEHDGDRDNRENAESSTYPIEVAVGIL